MDAADAANVTVTDGTVVTLTQPGEYDVDGACAEGQLVVDCDKDAYPNGQVTVNLRGLELSNTKDSPIYVAAVDDEFVLTVKADTENTVSDGTDYQNADGDSAAIYACDDMKIKGRGKLTVNGNCADGIVCKNDLKIWNGALDVTAADDGIRGKDSVRVGDPDATDGYADLSVTVRTQNGDGIKSTNDEDPDSGFVRVTGGKIDIDSAADGISAQQAFEMSGGEVNIHTLEGAEYTGSGSSSGSTGGMDGMGGMGGFPDGGNTNKTPTSAKGIKSSGLYDSDGTTYLSGGTLSITGGKLEIDSSDDCIHAAGTLTLTGGTLLLASADDAVHGDRDVIIGTQDAGTYDDVVITVLSCYEGIEGKTITQYSGSVMVTSTDDGYNAAGGADSSGNQSPGGWGHGGGFGSSGEDFITISGGFALVNVSDGDHDGFDSNGPLTIEGGYAVSNGTEAFDCGEGFACSYTGGVFVEDKGLGGMGFGGMGGTALTPDLSVSGSIAAGERVTLVDGSGNVIISFIADKAVSTVSAGVTGYSDVKVYSGGELSGCTYFPTADGTQTAAAGGQLTGGTQIIGSAESGGQGSFAPFARPHR